MEQVSVIADAEAGLIIGRISVVSNYQNGALKLIAFINLKLGHMFKRIAMKIRDGILSLYVRITMQRRAIQLKSLAV